MQKNKNYNSNKFKKFMMNGNKIAQKMRFKKKIQKKFVRLWEKRNLAMNFE
jgi:hypothetical protein